MKVYLILGTSAAALESLTWARKVTLAFIWVRYCLVRGKVTCGVTGMLSVTSTGMVSARYSFAGLLAG